MAGDAVRAKNLDEMNMNQSKPKLQQEPVMFFSLER